MAEVKYKTTERMKTDIIQEILDIKEQDGLTASNVVKRAKDKKSPLHDFFEWDNKVASHNWRLAQARNLINEIQIIVGEKKLFAFENVQIITTDGTKERAYMSKEEILGSEELRNQMIKRAFDQINFWKSQYSVYSELKPIFVSIDKTKKKLSKKWQQEKQQIKVKQ
jgi:hypothetical protein